MYEGERGENKREEKLENTALSLSPGRWRWKNSEEHGKLPGINLDAPVGQREEGRGRREEGGVDTGVDVAGEQGSKKEKAESERRRV